MATIARLNCGYLLYNSYSAELPHVLYIVSFAPIAMAAQLSGALEARTEGPCLRDPRGDMGQSAERAIAALGICEIG
jgi:hypothetical protein